MPGEFVDPLDDAVSRQYQRWVYPEPIDDIDRWLEGNWQWFDPSHAQPVLWPDRDPVDGLDILVAGCGANQAAVIAHTNPGSRVTGIDVSESSLDHQRELARSHSLGNLEVHRLPIERVGELGRDFDLVVSTGVLHHLDDPVGGLAALGHVLRVDGVLALMVYARFGRVGVGMMQESFRDLGLVQDPSSLEIVKATIRSLPVDHPVRGYLGIAPDLDHDAGVVDTFLHARDRTYTVDDCLALVRSAGLVFDDWFLKAPYQPHDGLEPSLLDALTRLPVERQWSVMERINWRNGCHFFTACRPERPRSSYVIDFTSTMATRFVPTMRHRCSVTDDGLARADRSVALDERHRALVRRIDGSRSIAGIAHEFVPESEALDLFHRLWRHDLVAVRLPGRDGP